VYIFGFTGDNGGRFDFWTNVVYIHCACLVVCFFFKFCATGTMGWSGNLTTGEILEQIVHADRILAEEWSIHKTPRLELVRNVVFMGMGYVPMMIG
jgi:adenine C2-methylase RlmN of 23S rRNA A2503 and tRNA A37